MILGYNVEKCPLCHSEINEASSAIVCVKCGIIRDKAGLLAAILGIDHIVSSQILKSGNYGNVPSPIEGDILAYNNDVLVNVYREGQVLMSYPSIFGSVDNQKDIIIICDDMSLVSDQVIGFNPPFQVRWFSLIAGKKITVCYRHDHDLAKTLCKRLYASGNTMVYIAQVEGSIYEAVLKAQRYEVNSVRTITKKNMDYTKVTLKEVIDRFHFQQDSRGNIYRRNINVPPYIVVESAIEWFKQNGAKWLWDTENSQLYMMFKNELYLMQSGNQLLRSLLFNEGGIIKSFGEGAQIIDGMCSMAYDADKISPEPWILGYPEKNVIKIHQGKETITISEGDVSVRAKTRVTYDMLRTGNVWFTPVSLTEGNGLKMLFDYVVNYFPLPQVGREVVICWLLANFMKHWSSTYPGLRIAGKASSGKSTMLQLMYWLFYGRNEDNLPAGMSLAGLWRTGAIEPFLPLDNENVESMDESFRTFLDVAASGGQRLLGVTTNLTDTRSQKAHTFVAISGLDNFLVHDVRTRYIEVTTGFEWKSDFIPIENKRMIMDNRDIILTSVFEMIAKDVLPVLCDYQHKDFLTNLRVLLDTKHRIFEYFSLMTTVGYALQKHGFIEPGNIEERWCTYIRDNATIADIDNAVTIEWVKNFKIALVNHEEDFIRFAEGSHLEVKTPFEILKNDVGKKIGMRGSVEVILNALAWAGRVLNRKLPWNSTKKFLNALHIDENAWKCLEWELINEKDKIVIKWGEVI